MVTTGGPARLIRWLPAAGWMLVIFGLSSLRAATLPPSAGYISSIAHFAEYAILGALLVFAVSPRRLTVPLALALLLAASLYGVSDEFHQSFVPGRMPDPMDWATDTAGAAAAIAATAAWRRRKGRR